MFMLGWVKRGTFWNVSGCILGFPAPFGAQPSPVAPTGGRETTTCRTAAVSDLWLAHPCVRDSVAGAQIIVSSRLYQPVSFCAKCDVLKKVLNRGVSSGPSTQQGDLSHGHTQPLHAAVGPDTTVQLFSKQSLFFNVLFKIKV